MAAGRDSLRAGLLLLGASLCGLLALSFLSARPAAVRPPSQVQPVRPGIPRTSGGAPREVPQGVAVGPERWAPIASPRSTSSLGHGGGTLPGDETSGGEVSAEVVREAIREAFADHFPQRSLGEGELERLTRAVLDIRRARRRLQELPVSQEHAREAEAARHELLEALAEFEAVAGMDAAEFTRTVEPGIGLTEEGDEGEQAPGAPVEPLSAYPPPG